MEGYNSAIFAYGKTGSGKTFTMLGDSKRTFYHDFALAGIIPRTLRYICRNLPENASSKKVQLSVSFVEIYKVILFDMFLFSFCLIKFNLKQENIYDLLVEEKMYNKIELRQEKQGVNIVGARKVVIKSEKDAEEVKVFRNVLIV